MTGGLRTRQFHFDRGASELGMPTILSSRPCSPQAAGMSPDPGSLWLSDVNSRVVSPDRGSFLAPYDQPIQLTGEGRPPLHRIDQGRIASRRARRNRLRIAAPTGSNVLSVGDFSRLGQQPATPSNDRNERYNGAND